MVFYRVQVAPIIDGLATNDQGEPHPLYQLPYPFLVNEDGSIRDQDFWQGTIKRVIGFQKDLAQREAGLDLLWRQVVENPDSALNMYLVTSDVYGAWGIHETAVIKLDKYLEEGDKNG